MYFFVFLNFHGKVYILMLSWFQFEDILSPFDLQWSEVLSIDSLEIFFNVEPVEHKKIAKGVFLSIHETW